MNEIKTALLNWLNTEGYTTETDTPTACTHAWKGPERCQPIMYTLQFAGLIEQSPAHKGDSSDKLNIWCSYTDKNDTYLGMFNTIQTFQLSNPQVFEQILTYLKHHDNNTHPIYGAELSYQRAKRKKNK